jgi:hypothetical protein
LDHAEAIDVDFFGFGGSEEGHFVAPLAKGVDHAVGVHLRASDSLGVVADVQDPHRAGA